MTGPDGSPQASQAPQAFETSGTTGPPVAWLRSPAQLAAEAELLAGLLGPVDRVVCHAPVRHLYGRVFGVEIPRLLGVPVAQYGDRPLDPPELDPDARTLLVCLPSTWQLLLRARPAPGGLRGLVAVHSTARVPGAAYEVTARLAGPGFRAVEVLGSTETGAVATRPVDPVLRDSAPWRLLPDVTLVSGGYGGGRPGPAPEPEPEPVRLTVAGPRLAHRPGEPVPESVEMPDLVVPAGERSFRRLGRAPDLVKVNGVRCELGRVELLVRRLAPDVDAVCVPLADEIRGEHYALYYAAPAGGPDPAELRSRLAGALGATLPGPRSVTRVRYVPRAGGSVLTAELPGLAVRVGER
ncbi:AMP-binding protein [Streptomyces sp. NPDC012888]|uniref:AMP-binding protein n=1 Tax=Streptomyces sp. NPDC012888 TaxID=3364855 RepID=UPI00367BFA5A